jgi:hypothetical protein
MISFSQNSLILSHGKPVSASRKSKLDGFSFLLELDVFLSIEGKFFSLLDMASFLFEEFGISVTKQSLHDRFTCSGSIIFEKMS